MRFWESSAIVPLLVEEPSSDAVRQVFDEDPEIMAWWSTGIECASALARQERDGALSSPAFAEAIRRLEALAQAWQEIQPVSAVRTTATRLLRVHSLRTGDALQLAAARVAAEEVPATLPFVTLDAGVALAAEREGFPVIQPGATA